MKKLYKTIFNNRFKKLTLIEKIIAVILVIILHPIIILLYVIRNHNENKHKLRIKKLRKEELLKLKKIKEQSDYQPIKCYNCGRKKVLLGFYDDNDDLLYYGILELYRKKELKFETGYMHSYDDDLFNKNIKTAVAECQSCRLRTYFYNNEADPYRLYNYKELFEDIKELNVVYDYN